MSKHKHTPGPFKVLIGAEDDEDRCSIVSAGPVPYHIATIENGQPGDCVETELATAHLFAAAPDLLEALEDILNASERLPAGHPSATEEERRNMSIAADKARAAIAKATQP